MKKMLQTLLYVCAVWMVFSACAFAQTNPQKPELTWDNVESEMEQAVKEGFEGALLLTRNGEIFLHKAWGSANREKGFKMAPDTIFAIGSCPIDFTHAGILLLKDQGKLSLDDPIGKFFEHVPADKQKITLRHLMTGASGLPDFHDIPTDKNPDHSWIDRDEAIRRIFSQRLLFEPGKGNEHSHSAWGLLAAVIEIVSGETYQAFTTERLFKPCGMNDTGFFGQTYPEERVAVGYGRKSSEPNSPPHWGKTSWLVMGSGGQVSTLGDLLKWEREMSRGAILSPESTKMFRQGGGLAADGDEFGFEFIHSRNPDQLFMLITNTCNSRKKRQDFSALARRLYRLVSKKEVDNQYTLGIAMNIQMDDDVKIHIAQVVAGSAAEKDGLEVGDQLISANGAPLGEDPLKVLSPFLQKGTPIEFKIKRGEENLQIRVTPTKKQ